MSNYTPDGWKIILINNKTIKVFAGWSGGYLSGDSWRINSGVMNIKETEDEYIVEGYSGSIYYLSKNHNYLSSYNENVFWDIINELESYDHKVEIISIDKAMEILENDDAS